MDQTASFVEEIEQKIWKEFGEFEGLWYSKDTTNRSKAIIDK